MHGAIVLIRPKKLCRAYGPCSTFVGRDHSIPRPRAHSHRLDLLSVGRRRRRASGIRDGLANGGDNLPHHLPIFHAQIAGEGLLEP